jgi:hypothetical protein
MSILALPACRHGAIVAVACALLSSAAPAQDAKKPPPLQKSGTVTIEQYQVALFWSGNLGGGELRFNNKVYPFTVGGLGVGGIGASKMEATGEVFNLKRLEDFPGTYGQARMGYAAGSSTSGTSLWLESPTGVVLELKAKREGLALAMGADAVYFAFK